MKWYHITLIAVAVIAIGYGIYTMFGNKKEEE